MIINLPVVLECPSSRECDPLQWWGPVPGNPVTFRQFIRLEDWRGYVTNLSPLGEPPEVIARGYAHTLRLLYLAWLDASVIKLAELATLANLEAAIKVKYQFKAADGLEAALRHLVNKVGVTDADLPLARECNSTVVPNLLLKKPPDGCSLSEIRNRLAHGDPFETMPWGGLFEIVRDLIDFIYLPPTHEGDI